MLSLYCSILYIDIYIRAAVLLNTIYTYIYICHASMYVEMGTFAHNYLPTIIYHMDHMAKASARLVRGPGWKSC